MASFKVGSGSVCQAAKQTTWGTSVTPTVLLNMTGESITVDYQKGDEANLIAKKTASEKELLAVVSEVGIDTILRPEFIDWILEAALGKKVIYDPSLKEDSQHVALDPAGGVQETDFQPKSPGMKYKHYAPKADMLVVEGQRDKVKAEIERLKALNERLGNNVGVILFEEKAFIEAAHDFFARLRDLDKEGVDLILAGALSDTDGVGFAVMNRMLKSAGYNIVRVS